jgi:hypothetical protein
MLEAHGSPVKHHRRARQETTRSERRPQQPLCPRHPEVLFEGAGTPSRPFTLGFNDPSQFQIFPCRKNAITSA